MKHKLLSAIIAVSIAVQAAAQVTPPYFNDFESGAAGWTDTSYQGSSWQLGTPNYGTTTGALSGVNAWDIDLDTAYVDSTNAFLMTPVFDLSSTVNPILSFWINYNTENTFDGFVIEYSANGLPWAPLGAFPAAPPYYNWFTNPLILSGFFPGWSGNSMGWRHSLMLALGQVGLAGQSAVQFRFRFASDEIVQLDGVSMDNFALYDQSAEDAGCWQVISPYPFSTQGISRPVQVIVFNYGTNPQTTFDVSYSLNGGAPVTQTWNGNLAQGESDTVTFPSITVPSGGYTIKAYTSLAGDMYAVNDTAPAILTGVIPTIETNSNPDTTSYGPCDIPHLFQDQVTGTTTGLNPGDTVWLHAAWGDGTDTLYQTTISTPNFSINISHEYTFPGQYSLQYITYSYGGLGADTLTLINEVLLEDSCGTITGLAYLDANANCVFDAGDTFLQYQPLVISSGGNPVWWELTDVNGAYQFDMPAGPTYDVSISLPAAIYASICPPSGMYTGISSLPSTGNDFAVGALPGFDLEPVLSVSGFSLLQGGNVQVSVRNNLLMPVTGTLSIPVDTSLYSLVSVMPPPTTFNNDTLSWNTGMLSYGSGLFQVSMQLSLQPSVQVGDTICLAAIAEPVVADSVPSNNVKSSCRPVVLALDPNTKSADPPGTALNGMELNYQVDFQNTGADTAVNVFILDTLDANLDINTLRILGASHPMTTVFIGPRVIKFTFNNILLPDSGSSEPESRGYVHYAISPLPGLPVGTVILNTASVYFDFNPAVVTNTTVNTIIGTVGIGEAEASVMFGLYPNPTSGAFMLIYNLPAGQAGLLEVYNLRMQQVLEMQLPEGSTEQRIELPDASDGLYQVVLTSGAYRATQKVAVMRGE